MSNELTLNILLLAVSSGLVFFMQAGFAMLEAGLVRSKNAVNVLMKNYNDMCFGGLAFWLFGFGLMFGKSENGWLGLTDFYPGNPATTNREYAIFLYQIMFCATAATIMSGALAERIRYSAYVMASIGVSGLIYPVFGCWAWGAALHGETNQGWLQALGYIDFAGSSVVHACGGWCALAGVIVLGPRLGRYGADGEVRTIPGHNQSLVCLGVFILWFGWFGFNGGSVFETNISIGKVLVNTHLAGLAGAVSAAFTMTLLGRPLLMSLAANGGLGGLVAITAGAGSMTPPFAILTGIIGGAVVIVAGIWIDKMQWDDSVGAVSVHAGAGTWGVLAAGLFHEAGFQWHQVGVQALGAATCMVWSFCTAWVMFQVIGFMVRLRVTTREEQRGLDYVEHHELGYPEFQESLHRKD